jgi:hypothetical protein
MRKMDKFKKKENASLEYSMLCLVYWVCYIFALFWVSVIAIFVHNYYTLTPCKRVQDDGAIEYQVGGVTYTYDGELLNIVKPYETNADSLLLVRIDAARPEIPQQILVSDPQVVKLAVLCAVTLFLFGYVASKL